MTKPSIDVAAELARLAALTIFELRRVAEAASTIAADGVCVENSSGVEGCRELANTNPH